MSTNNPIPPGHNEAVDVLREASQLLYFGEDGVSLFSAVLVVGCYSQLDADGGVTVRAAAAMHSRDDFPESTERMLHRLREIVADLEQRVAQEKQQQRQHNQQLS